MRLQLEIILCWVVMLSMINKYAQKRAMVENNYGNVKEYVDQFDNILLCKLRRLFDLLVVFINEML